MTLNCRITSEILYDQTWRCMSLGCVREVVRSVAGGNRVMARTICETHGNVKEIMLTTHDDTKAEQAMVDEFGPGY